MVFEFFVSNEYGKPTNVRGAVLIEEIDTIQLRDTTIWFHTKGGAGNTAACDTEADATDTYNRILRFMEMSQKRYVELSTPTAQLAE